MKPYDPVAKNIIRRVEPWAGSENGALAWYYSTTIPALGDLTPEALVSNGRSDDVMAYLDHLNSGGHA